MTRRPLDTTQEFSAGAPGRARRIRRHAEIRGAFSRIVSCTAAAPPTTRRRLALPHPFGTAAAPPTTRRRLSPPHPFRPRTMETS